MKALTPSPTKTVSPGAAARRTTFSFLTQDVTGTHSLEAKDVPRSSPAGAIAQALASKMSLPENIPWTLRNDRTGAYLDEQSPIGDQIDSGAKVTLTPKTHLG